MLPISISFPSPYLFLPIPTITQLVPKILPSTMSATEQAEVGAGRPSLTAVTGILVAGVIASVALFVLVFFLYLRAKRYWGAIPVSVPAVGARASLAEPGAATPAPQQRRGLEAATVAALPSLVFRSGDCRDGLECAVCLCELSDGEVARLLPRCSHAFHLECIDTWFSSHSTCPLCRNPVVVALENAEDADSGAGLAHPEESSPENPADAPLCASEDRASWGDPGSQEGSSSSSGCSSGSPQAALAIEIPGRAVDGFQTPNSPLPASVLPEDEVVRSPPAATLRSLRRILIRGSRMGCASCSPRGCDVEQGCVPVSKVPTSS